MYRKSKNRHTKACTHRRQGVYFGSYNLCQEEARFCPSFYQELDFNEDNSFTRC